jgi:hypothetical protein
MVLQGVWEQEGEGWCWCACLLVERVSTPYAHEKRARPERERSQRGRMRPLVLPVPSVTPASLAPPRRCASSSPLFALASTSCVPTSTCCG